MSGGNEKPETFVGRHPMDGTLPKKLMGVRNQIKNLEEILPRKDVNRANLVLAGKTLFITGGTGFLGAVFVEKMLRTIDDLKKIYLLIRPKKGKEPKDRLKELFKKPLFDLLRRQKGDGIFDKVDVIYGDVSQLNLGMSPEDRATIHREVHVIVHMAATIRFDDPLKKAVILNTRGTMYMMELAVDCKALDVFIHVSTSYAHLGERILYERPYPPPADPYEVIKKIEWLDEGIVEAMTQDLLGHLPNTYAFTKALGEAIAIDYMDVVPVLVVRPSVVVPVWLDPLPGWTDNINGPTGLLIAAGKGVLRTMYCDEHGYADFLPADVAANATCLLICDFYRTNGKRRIINLTSSAEYKFTWQEIIEIGRNVVEKRLPLNGVAWYPGGSMKKNRFYHNVCVVLFHYIPAVLIDMLVFCLGYKPFMWKVQTRITKGFDVFEYYANNQWDFSNEDSLKSREDMNPVEKELYKVDGTGLDLEEYFYNCVKCARLYILKEPEDTIPAARRHMKVMWFVDKLTKLLLTMFFFYMIYKYIYCSL